MAPATCLYFVGREFWPNRLWNTNFSPCAKFHANISYSDWDVAIKPFFKVATAAILDFLIVKYECITISRTAVLICAKFCASMGNNDPVMAVKVNFKMAAATILNVLQSQFLASTLCLNKKAQLSLTNPRDAKACQNCSNSTCLQRCRWQYWPIFMRSTAIASEIREIPRNSLKIQTYGVQGHPRSSILVSIESPYVTCY